MLSVCPVECARPCNQLCNSILRRIPAITDTTMITSPSQELLTQIIKQDALENRSSRPVYLSSVEVQGGEYLLRQFFTKLLHSLVERSDYTLGQLLHTVDESQNNLLKTNIFKSVKSSLHVDYLHPVPEPSKNYNREKLIPTKVVFDLEGTPSVGGDAALGFNTEDNLEVKLGYLNNNFNHNAELINVGVNYRPYKPNEHLLSSMKFVSNLRDPSYRFVFDLYHSQSNNRAWQLNSVKTTGGTIGVSYTSQTNLLSAFTGLSLNKRTAYDIDDGAVDSVKQFAGNFLKLSVVSHLAYNNVSYYDSNRKVFPKNGFSAVARNEISSDQEQEELAEGLSFFIKLILSLNLYKSFFNNAITAHIFNEAGNIYIPRSNGSKLLHISDRFYLGGYNSFRGFARNSVNTEGGLQFYKTGLTLYSKLPQLLRRKRTEGDPLRLYATGLVGNVGEDVLATSSGAALSGGAGLRYFNEWVNFDVGYFVSQRYRSSDAVGVRDGFQLEVSIGGTNRT